MAAAATEAVSIQLTPKAFEFFDPQTDSMTVKPGVYEILYGGSSADTALKSIMLTVN
ncbi:MAG: fibronectin type III-like domain-contianing protein [Prevotellaceae bacterium]|nr:fibronectin type III-like domain-contianing protein [Prevotellaceae bacterium]